MTGTDRIAEGQDEGVHCPGCGYDLRGATSERCPECGLRVDAAMLQLTWERRAELGRWRAFARTAWLASVHPNRLARLIAGRVDVPSARRFRWLVLTILALATLSAFFSIVGRAGGPGCFNLVSDRVGRGAPSVNALALFWSAGAMCWPVLPSGLVLAMWAGTAWDHWFVLRDLSPVRRNRAMAAARYTVAPMLGCGVAVAMTAVWLGAKVDAEWLATNTERELKGLAILMAGVIAVLTVTAPARYAAALPGGGGWRFLLVLGGTAVQWMVVLAVGVGLFPAVVGFAVVVIDSVG